MPDEGWRSPTNKIAIGSGIVSFATMVVSLFALLYACDANKTAKTESERRGRLGISDVTSVFKKVDGKITSATGTEESTSQVLAPQIDLRVRNQGSGEARIDHVEVTVRQSHVLKGCYGTGEGLETSANYEVAISPDESPPFSQVHPLDFTVPSGEYERFNLVIGPEGELATPWVGVVSLRFRSDDGDDLDTAPIALAMPGSAKEFHLEGTSWTIEPTDQKECQRQNVETVGSVRRTPDLVEPAALASLEEALRKAT